MPIIKSAKKALRQSKKREAKNKVVKRELKKAIKGLRQASQAKDSKKVEELMPMIYKKIDKAAKRGLIKKNTASRKKSRLSKAVNKKSRLK